MGTQGLAQQAADVRSSCFGQLFLKRFSYLFVEKMDMQP